jgi:hypothetical protein
MKRLLKYFKSASKALCYITALTAAGSLSAGATPAFASDGSSGYITEILPTNGTAAFFIHGGTRTTPPACAAGSGPRWVIDLSTPGGQAIMATILTAFSTNRPVHVVGTGTCALSPTDETVGYLVIS